MADQQLAQHTDSGAQSLVKMGDRGLELKSLNDAWRFAQMVAQSGMAPKGMQEPQQIMIAIQMGAELGLAPMQALQNVAVINGRPSLWGDAMLALVEESGLLVDFWEEVEGEGDKMVAICFSQRKGRSRGKTTRFSVEDAKKASLWGKTGPWSQYPKRMLQMRARSFNLRDNFPDVLRGLRIAEEVMDMPPAAAPDHAVSRDEQPVDAEFKPAPTSRADRLAGKLKRDEEQEATPVEEPATLFDEPETPAEPSVPLATPGQVTALSIALKAAGFKATAKGKEEGRSFLAFMASLDSLESAKDLTREQAAMILDSLGEDTPEGYRANKSAVEKAVADWADAQAGAQLEAEQQ